MLKEILVVEQNDLSLKRRWFESEYFDLFIWQDPGGAFASFQLCYDVELNERALVWNGAEGFYHDGVDTGGIQAPILVRDGKCDFVLAKMREHLIELHRQKMGRKRVRRERWQQRKLRFKTSPKN